MKKWLINFMLNRLQILKRNNGVGGFDAPHFVQRRINIWSSNDKHYKYIISQSNEKIKCQTVAP